MKVLVGRNIRRPSAGIIQEVLEEKGVEFEIYDFDSCKDLDPKNYNAVIVMGGPDSANDQTKKMKKEIEFVQQALDNKIPYLGICLGMQVLIKATNGKVHRNKVPELAFRDPDRGYHEIELTKQGKKVDIFEGLPKSFNAFQLHYETTEFNGGHQLLATGKFCKNQAVQYGNAFGTQFHFELTGELFEKSYKTNKHFKHLSVEQLENDFERLKEQYEKNGRQIMENFIRKAEQDKEVVVAKAYA